jgi:hypothetical protein
MTLIGDGEMVYDFQQRTSECEYFSPPDIDQIDKARLVVCANATDAEDAEELLRELGIHPSQEGVFDPVLALPPLPTQKAR